MVTLKYFECWVRRHTREVGKFCGQRAPVCCLVVCRVYYGWLAQLWLRLSLGWIDAGAHVEFPLGVWGYRPAEEDAPRLAELANFERGKSRGRSWRPSSQHQLKTMTG